MAVDYLNCSISDHSPLLLKVGSDQQSGGRPFRFFNYLAQHSQFEKLVQQDWSKPIQGNPLSRIWFKLKRLKLQLKHLHKEEFAGIESRIQQSQQELDHVQGQLQVDSADLLLQVEEKRLTDKLRKWL